MVVLTDVLQPNLKIVFCGMAVGTTSAQECAYYAHSRNRFWQVLFNLGLTSEHMTPQEFGLLPNYGIGLTDLIKSEFGTNDQIDYSKVNFPGCRAQLRVKVEKYVPKALA